MSAKLHELEYFYSVEQMDRAFSDAAGEVAAMHLGFTAKKPDKNKVKDLIAKGKNQPAKFFLVLDGLKLTFEVRVGTTGRIVLNTLDLNAIKDTGKRRELLVQLNRRAFELVSKDDLSKFDKEHAGSDNPALQKAASEIGEQITELENQLDNLNIMLDSPNYKKKEYSSYDSEFKHWVESKNFGRFTAFVDEAENGSLGSDGLKIFDDPKTSGINPQTLQAIKAAWDKGEKADLSEARKQVIAKVINGLLLPRYNQEKTADLTKQIKERSAKVADLKKKLAALENK